MLPDYNVIVQPLDTAETDKRYEYKGTYLEFSTDGSFTGVSVRVDSKKADSIPLDRFKQQRYPAEFTEFFVTWTAQTGKTLWIFVGRRETEARRV